MPKLDEFSLRPKKVLSVLFPFIRVESFLVVSIDMSLPIIPQLLTASSLLDDNKRRVAIRIFLVFYLPLLRLLVHANISSAYNIVVNKQRNSRHCSKTYDSAQSEFPSKFFWMNIALPKKQLQSLNLWKVVQSCCFFSGYFLLQYFFILLIQLMLTQKWIVSVIFSLIIEISANQLIVPYQYSNFSTSKILINQFPGYNTLELLNTTY